MSDSSVTILAPAGELQGTHLAGINRFVGIRYAQAPVADARFLPPRPLASSDKPIDATRFGDRNYQVGQPEIFTENFELPGGESEDCLFLNVYAPTEVQEPVPVLVWIHGGAFIGGSGNQYDPTNLVLNHDVIVVTINYRLGIFGFLNLARLGEDYAGSANLGLQDQIAALNWVQQNIAAFGGDASNVTIFGESAGAASVMALLGAPAAEGLFHKAMAFSGSETMAPPMEHLDILRLQFGVETDRECLDRLMAMTGDELTQLQQDVRMYHGAGLDGFVLTRVTRDAIRDGWAGNIPILTGNTKDEGTMLAPGFVEFAHEAVATIYGLAASIGSDDGSAYMALLDREYEQDDLLQRMSRCWTDTFRSGALRVAAAASQYGAGGWVYNFDVETDDPLGVTHASDIPFIFNWTDEAGEPIFFWHDNSEINKQLSQQWSATLVEFARSGSPNGRGLPQWPQYQPGQYECLRLCRQPAIVANPDGDMLSLYRVIQK